MKRYDVDPTPGIHQGIAQDLAILLATWQDGTREWRENLGTPPVEAIIWQPYESGPSIGGLLLHMAACETYWLREFAHQLETPDLDAATQYDRTVDQHVPHWPAPPGKPIEWYYDVLDRTRRDVVHLAEKHANPTSLHPRKDYEVSYRWIIAHVLEHDSYHGGQAVLLHEFWKKLNPGK
jgi:uncharacterized damage-inducible protein DinB